MALTRAQVESILVRRCSNYMKAAEMDGETIQGTNADLNDPIGVAIRACDGTTTLPSNVVDADLVAIDVADYDKLFDIAELRILESVLSQYDKFGLKVGPRSEYQSQLVERLEPKLKRMQKRAELMYGWAAPTFEAGAISLDFAEHNEALPSE